MSEPLPSVPTPSHYPAPGSAPSAYPQGTRQEDFDNTPPLTQMERVANTFFAPSKTFADIRRNRSWWLPFLLIAVFGYVFSGVALKRIGVDGLAESAMRSNPAQYEKMQAQPPEQRARVLSITRISMQAGFVAFPVIQLLSAAVLALLLWAGFNFILGGTSTYGGMYAVAMFAFLPSILKSLLSVGTMFLADPDSFNISDPVGTNPGYYLSTDAAAWLKSLLGSLDLFTIWTVFLFALGGAIVARVKPASGYALVFGAWLLIVLVKVGFAAAMS